MAPHPDDEVIACGGLIQQALALGDSVWIVYVTSGDGSWPSAWRVTGNLLPGTNDYLELGRTRIEEAKSGAGLLGVDTTHLVFLGYPDGNLAHLWQQNWSTPYRSTQTGAVADPYRKDGHEYTGRQLLNDLDSLLRTVKPAQVFTPHPCDAHPDHWSTAMFVAIAREAWRQARDVPFPDVYCYLVHRPPYPGAWTDGAGFLWPPDELTGTGHHWFTTTLRPAQSRVKRSALDCHCSQLGNLGSDVYRYVVANELFDRIEDATASVTEDAPQMGFVHSARFSSVEAHIERESLSLGMSLKARPSPEFAYSLFARSIEFDADTTIQDGFTAGMDSAPSADFRERSARIPWTGHARPGVLFFSAEVRLGTVLVNHSGIGRVVY